MKTVFLSGSRKSNLLNDRVRNWIKELINQGTHLIVGDASGADKAMQKYLADQHYQNVKVYCSGSRCRNNIGDWDLQKVFVGPNLKGRAFYTQKDKEMASIADSGFVLWDGKSIGSINNVRELLNNGKTVVVYFSPKQQFIDVTNFHELEELIHQVDQSDARVIRDRLKLIPTADDQNTLIQGELNLGI